MVESSRIEPKLSDETKVAGKEWNELKTDAMKPDYLKKQGWFVSSTKLFKFNVSSSSASCTNKNSKPWLS